MQELFLMGIPALFEKLVTFISVVGQADPIAVLLDRHADEQIVLLKLTTANSLLYSYVL